MFSRMELIVYHLCQRLIPFPFYGFGDAVYSRSRNYGLVGVEPIRFYLNTLSYSKILRLHDKL